MHWAICTVGYRKTNISVELVVHVFIFIYYAHMFAYAVMAIYENLVCS